MKRTKEGALFVVRCYYPTHTHAHSIPFFMGVCYEAWLGNFSSFFPFFSSGLPLKVSSTQCDTTTLPLTGIHNASHGRQRMAALSFLQHNFSFLLHCFPGNLRSTRRHTHRQLLFLLPELLAARVATETETTQHKEICWKIPNIFNVLLAVVFVTVLFCVLLLFFVRIIFLFWS